MIAGFSFWEGDMEAVAVIFPFDWFGVSYELYVCDGANPLVHFG